MNILKQTYAKVIDRLTIEEAPKSYNGIIGFSNNAELCIKNGFKPVNYMPISDGWRIYEEKKSFIQESYFEPDEALYKSRVIELIRCKYSVDDEASIIRKKLSGIDTKSFDLYNEYVESSKKIAKLEQIK